MTRFNRFHLIAASAVVALAPALTQAQSLRMASVTTEAARDASYEFKRLVEEATGGSLEIKVFPDNQLGDDRVVTESTIFGDIDIGISSTSPQATLFADFYAFDAPFLFLSPEDAYAKLDGEIGQKILASMEAKGLKGLAFWENGFRNLTNNDRAIKLPADLDGLKIRTMENEVHLEAWRAFGANPTPMAFTELFTALQQGTVDAQENPLGIIDGNRFQEVQDHVSLTQHVYNPFILFMNLDRFNSLSAEQQDAILKAAKETTKFQRDLAQDIDIKILDGFAEKGVTVVELTQEEKAAWQQVVKDAKIYDLVKSRMDNPDYLEAFLAN